MATTHPLSTGAVLTAIERELDAVDHAGRALLGHAERLSLVDAARHVARRVAALVAALVGEAEQADSAMQARRTPLPTLLAQTAGAAAETPALIRAGRTLAAHPAVQVAALAGQVSLEQARSIDRVLAGLPDGLDEAQRAAAEGVLLGKAAGHSAEQIARLGPHVLRAVAPDVVADENGRLAAQARRARQRRALSFWTEDGSTHFRGNLPTVDAAAFVKLIDARLEADRRATRHLPDVRTPGQKRADALVALVAAHQQRGGSPGVGGDRPRVVVLLDEAALRGRAEAAGVLDTGQPIAPGELRRLCCDAEIVPAVLGGDSEVLDLGRAARLITPAQRLALAVRDRGCVFPGCEVPAHRCQAHHIAPWCAGGRGDLDNLVLLCPTHHALIEPRGPAGTPLPTQWRIERHPLTGKPQCVPARE